MFPVRVLLLELLVSNIPELVLLEQVFPERVFVELLDKYIP